MFFSESSSISIGSPCISTESCNIGMGHFQEWVRKIKQSSKQFVSPEENKQAHKILRRLFSDMNRFCLLQYPIEDPYHFSSICQICNEVIEQEEIMISFDDIEELHPILKDHVQVVAEALNETDLSSWFSQILSEFQADIVLQKPYFASRKQELLSKNFANMELTNWFKAIIKKEGIPEKEMPPLEKVKKEKKLSKARTFYLFLLSALEDLKENMGKNSELENDIQVLNEIIDPLYTLFEDPRQFELLRRQFSFTSLMEFISIAKKHSSNSLSLDVDTKLNRILDNVANLIHFQQFLPTHWQKLRLYMKLGVLRQKHLPYREDALSKGFSPIVQTPSPINLINRAARADAENMLSSNYRKIGKWLFDHIQYISFDQLCTSIESSCVQLAEQIRNWDSYVLMGVKNKSQSWLADIAYRYLPEDNLPVSLVLAENEGYIYDVFKEQILNHNIIIIDDGIYSGTQLKETLEDLKDVLFYMDEQQSFNNDNRLFFEQERVVTVIVGYANPKRIEAILSDYNFDIYNVKLQIICNHHVPVIEELMDRSGFDQQQQRLFYRLTNKLSDDLLLPLVTAEWKRPDHLSLVTYCSEGYLPTISLRIAENPSFRHPIIFNPPGCNRLFKHSPITEVKPPYKFLPKLLEDIRKEQEKLQRQTHSANA